LFRKIAAILPPLKGVRGMILYRQGEPLLIKKFKQLQYLKTGKNLVVDFMPIKEA